MADKSTISDDYKEIDNTSEVTPNKLEQHDEVNSKKENVDEPQIQENKPITNTITGKISQTLTEAGKEGKNAIKKSFSIEEQDNTGGIKSIVLGLFALIGFIILVYSIFIAVIGEPLASVADTVFIAALIGSFTLVATIISHIYIKRSN
ncbi:MAG: hypothetical protein K0S93_1185 [Nitrososphaeraceae archaeon]|nr:hypothetical protein [Nitrososphaeraceae archaeon]